MPSDGVQTHFDKLISADSLTGGRADFGINDLFASWNAAGVEYRTGLKNERVGRRTVGGSGGGEEIQ